MDGPRLLLPSTRGETKKVCRIWPHRKKKKKLRGAMARCHPMAPSSSSKLQMQQQRERKLEGASRRLPKKMGETRKGSFLLWFFLLRRGGRRDDSTGLSHKIPSLLLFLPRSLLSRAMPICTLPPSTMGWNSARISGSKSRKPEEKRYTDTF